MKIKNNLLFGVGILLLLMQSCAVVSFYPLFTQETLVRNDKIIGKWQNSENNYLESNEEPLVWEISFDKDKKVKPYISKSISDRDIKRDEPNRFSYTLEVYRVSNPENKATFQLHLVELAGQTYLDFFLEDWNMDNTMIASHVVAVHSFAKVDIENSRVVISWFDYIWFTEQLKDKQIRVKHENNGENILITAQPKDLQKFVKKYSKDEKAFADSQVILVPFR